ENIVRKNILSLVPYSSARDEFSGASGVFLDANENPFGELNRYPDPYQKSLKQKLAILKKVDTKNVFIGNGSDEVIDLVYRIFCNPKTDKALTFSPTYGMYDVSAAINDVKLTKIPLSKEFQIDRSKMDNYLVDSTYKVLFLCSPNNPTGNLINENDIEYLLHKFRGIVIIDEAYIDFSASTSWINRIERYSNLIVSQTFSKAWGLAGARVGVAYASKEIIQLMNRVKPPYNVSELNQKAAINALDDFDTFQNNINVILKEKEQLIEALNQLNLIVKIYPSEANFLLVEVINANAIYAELVAQKIITRNRNNVINNCIRISIGTPEENEKLLNGLKNINR
ncbi:MAG: histidinol-phosphate transaminase, partial [Cyclobacteriaceae bacterium]|nr:histidinol-phosphate transaminase [Cyclobacteriaceae bacterium]